ncbi:hypothetical protein CTI14_00395 [Methylobacterium radiotolerans]|nr:hypothetical protein CTI14_00395 [Methylobacterium radiotolerans]
MDLEAKVGVPIESALTFAKLMDSWFAHVGLVTVPPGNPFLGINEEERRTIAFGFADLVERLSAIDEQVNGPGGICPR